MLLIFIICFSLLLGAALLFLWLLYPAKPTSTMWDLLQGAKFAHRGLFDNKGDAPENSLKSFAAAAQKGYAIELDVRLTKDKVAVVFHDDSLIRMCGVQAAVSALTLSQIKELHLFETEELVPTLEEFLALVKGRVSLLVEFKSGLPGGNGAGELCSTVMEQLDFYDGDYVIESFDYAVLEWFKRNRPNVMRGQLSMGSQCFVSALGKKGAMAIPLHRRKMLSWLLYNFKSRPHFISYRYQDIGFLVRLCRRLGAMISVWTVKNPEESARLLEQYNAVIFDDFLA